MFSDADFCPYARCTLTGEMVTEPGGSDAATNTVAGKSTSARVLTTLILVCYRDENGIRKRHAIAQSEWQPGGNTAINRDGLRR